MQSNYVQRLRLTYSKNGPARFIGHLDLARTVERSLNRARIPIAYTQGFNRRPRLSFAAALPLGYTSEFELADIWLLEEMAPAAALDQMMRNMAPGIAFKAVKEIPLKSPSLQSLTYSAQYSAYLYDLPDNVDLAERVEQLLAEKSLIREKKRGKGKVKRYDLRPLIQDLVSGVDSRLEMTLFLMSGKSGRPDEVIAALGFDPLAVRVHRTMITLADPDGFTG